MTFFYLATPYTKYPDGLNAAAEDAARIAGLLLKAGLPVYSPIAHSHALAVAAGLSLTGHEFWMEVDAPFVEAATGLIVAKMEGWDESAGVAHEIAAFIAAGKPVLYLDPADL